VHLEGRATAIPPVPPYIEVWRSVRATGDTKTRRSRRTLALPGRCIDALRAQRVQQAADRLAAGPSWKDSGLVFTTAIGSEMDPANVRRDLRRALKLVPGMEPKDWTPRELRHSFVSLFVGCRRAGRDDLAAGRPPRYQRHWDCVSASDSAGHSDGRDRDG
jgi:integrase